MQRKLTATLLSVLALAGLAFAGFAVSAGPQGAGPQGSGVERQVVTAAALPNLPGHSLTAVTVELAPGVTVPAHRHEGFVFVYVLQGTVRSQLDAGKALDYAAGTSWVEPPGTLHSLTQNPSQTESTKVLAVFVAKDGARLTTADEAGSESKQ